MLNRLATVSLCPNPKLFACVCVFLCHAVVWGLLSSPRGSFALSLGYSLSLCLAVGTHSIAKRVQPQYQYQQQHQPQLTEIILVEFRNFYFNSVISKKLHTHTHSRARVKEVRFRVVLSES